MRRESRLGRALWIGLLIVLGGYVVADFVRSPFLAPSGSAAVRAAQITLWAPAGEAGGDTGAVVQGSAASLELSGHPTVVKTVSGGSSQAVARFLSQPPHDGSADLLVISSATVADLAHDGHDRLVPGAAEEAAVALELLRRAIPMGLIESDPLTIAVDADSPIASPAQLLSVLRGSPSEQLVGIADDTWSRVELASLVDRAGVDGNVRFSIFQSGTEAGRAVGTTGADIALGTRGALREGLSSGQLRTVEWPFDQGRAPRFWVALVAPPGLPHAKLVKLRGWIAGLPVTTTEAPRDVSAGTDPSGARLAGLLRDDLARADRLELLSQRVERN